MPTLLHIDSSPMGSDSISRRLTREFVDAWLTANSHGRVIVRDLTTIAIPVIDAAWDAANRTPKEMRTQRQKEILALSTQFTSELFEAGEYIIGTPMHNLGPASSFKLWIDQIVRFGETIVLTPSGPKGTLGEKRATFVIAAGGFYGPGSANPSWNYVEPWLRTLFAYIGVENKNMRFIIADGCLATKCGKMDRAAFLAPHLGTIHALFPTGELLVR